MLRWGITLRVEHLRGDESLSTTYNHYARDEYSEWVNCNRSFGGGCSSSGNQDLIDATKIFLRLVRDNHLDKIEDLYNSILSILSIPEKDRNNIRINVKWDQEELEAPFAGTIFGNFTPIQSVNIEEHFEQERLIYTNRVAKIKLLVSNNLNIRKDQYWDSDEDINAPADLTLECNQDIVKPKYASDYLRNGDYPPNDVKFDRKAVEAAIESKQLDLVKWALEQCDSKTLNIWGQTYIRVACEQEVINIVKYLISELKIIPDGKSLRGAVLSGNKELIDYLVSLNVSTDRVLDLLEYQEVTDTTWNLIKYVHSICPLHFGDIVLRGVISNKERFEWLLLAGAGRKYAIYDAARDRNFNITKILLDTDSINYETPEKRHELLFNAFDGMVQEKDDNAVADDDKFKPIYELLIEYGLFDKISMTRIIDTVQYESSISIFEYAENILGSERWNELLTPKLAFKLYQRSPINYFDKLIKIDLQATFRLLANRKAGIDKIVDYYSHYYGGDWMNKIDPKIHDYIIHCSGNPKYAISKGFKLYQSIYHNIGYRSAKELFSICSDIIKDDEVGWAQQEKIFKEHTFVDSHCNELEENQKYRVIVFDWGNEEKGKDDYWRESAIYDIQNAIVIENSHRGIKMEGTNNGPLKQLYSRGGEPSWNDERKSFFLVNEENCWSFHTGRDGGSLNCGGGYYVRIIKQ
jgi:hypothetical protein